MNVQCVVSVSALTHGPLCGPGCRFMRCSGYWRVILDIHLRTLGRPGRGVVSPGRYASGARSDCCCCGGGGGGGGGGPSLTVEDNMMSTRSSHVSSPEADIVSTGLLQLQPHRPRREGRPVGGFPRAFLSLTGRFRVGSLQFGSIYPRLHK